MRIKIGLTGSIGMGKSTTARLFAERGCKVWDADAAVHRLYALGGAAVVPLAKAFPSVVIEGQVSRDAIKSLLADRPDALKQIEAIVHPLVRADRERFMSEHMSEIGVFDIPLLFETGSDLEFDVTVCVTVPEAEQRRRVLARGTMTEAQLDHILSRQMPNAEKCARADYVIVTDTVAHAEQQVDDILRTVSESVDHA